MGCNNNCSSCSEKCDIKDLRAKPHYLSSVKKIIGVVSGKGGNTILDFAKKVLHEEFPEYANINISMPDEKNRRVGQSIAAACLPKI